MVAEHLKSPIAILNDHGGIEWRNRAFETSFGSATPNWIADAARVVAGERGWLQGFFIPSEEQRSIDVDIAGRRLAFWTGLFLLTTVLTSVTGFGFPFDHLLPSHKVGTVTLPV